MRMADQRNLTALHDKVKHAQNELTVVSEAFARYVSDLHAEGGVSFTDLGRVLGVTRGRVGQLVEKGNRLRVK